MAHRVRQHDHDGDLRFSGLAKLLHGADVASVNLESSVFDLGRFSGWPAAERGGSYLLSSPFVLDELAGLGFGLFARANNHAGDWGIEGLLATSEELDRRGIAHAGVGRNLAEASAPTYLDTLQGRVAMVSLTTTFPVSSMAAPQRRDIVGRPGCNGISVERRLQLAPDVHDEVARAIDAYGDPGLFERSNMGISPGAETAIIETLSPADVERVMAQIEKAAALADLVLVNGHTHEPANHVVAVPDWLVGLAHRCIDAGASAYSGHGPHQLRGMDIYQGRPIFYSLGNFVVHRDTQDPIPADQYRLFGLDPQSASPHEYVAARDARKHRLSMINAEYHESVVALVRFASDGMVELELHPIELSVDGSPGTRGTPRLAEPDHATRILERMAALSEEFGVSFDIENGVGLWKREARKANT